MNEKKKKDVLAESVVNLSTNISNMISTQNRAKDEVPMKYESILRNLDNMFQKMDEEAVFELNVQFVSMAFDKMKKK